VQVVDALLIGEGDNVVKAVVLDQLQPLRSIGSGPPPAPLFSASTTAQSTGRWTRRSVHAV